jgi:hypothetical protein
VAAAQHTGCRRPPPRRRAGGRRRGGRPAGVAAEEGSGPGAAGAASRGGPPRRGRRCASVREDVGVAELADGGRRCCTRVEEEWRDASEKRGASGTGAARRDSDGGEERRWRGEAIWGETAKCRSGRRRDLYRTPDLLSRVVYTTMTKGPLVSGCITTQG